jgi:hypothetical protein
MASNEALLRRVDELKHEINLLVLGMAEVNERLESALALFKMDLAANEDRIRRQESGDEDLVG